MSGPQVTVFPYTAVANRGQLVIGQLVRVVKGSLRGLVGALRSIEQGKVLIQLTHARSAVFLRVPLDAVANHEAND